MPVDSSDSPFQYNGLLPLMAVYLLSHMKYVMETYNENEIKYTHPETEIEFNICCLINLNVKEEVKLGPHIARLLTTF